MYKSESKRVASVALEDLASDEDAQPKTKFPRIKRYITGKKPRPASEEPVKAPELPLLPDDEEIDFASLQDASDKVVDQCKRLRNTLQAERLKYAVLKQNYDHLGRTLLLQQKLNQDMAQLSNDVKRYGDIFKKDDDEVPLWQLTIPGMTCLS